MNYSSHIVTHSCFIFFSEAIRKDQRVPRPVKALAQVRVVKLAAGQRHVLALSYSGKVYSWGEGADGQLGELHTVGGQAYGSSVPLLSCDR
jgi:hypothetical protein